MDESCVAWVEVDLAAYRHNLREVARIKLEGELNREQQSKQFETRVQGKAAQLAYLNQVDLAFREWKDVT